jgi:hypothetical protein
MGELFVYRREEYSRREPIEDAQLAPVGGLAEAEHLGTLMMPSTNVLRLCRTLLAHQKTPNQDCSLCNLDQHHSTSQAGCYLWRGLLYPGYL